MKCDIVRDLIPMYIEKLCSDETASEVKAHIETCDECRALLDKQSENITPEIKNEAAQKEVQPFKKINRKMKKNKWLIAVMAVVITAIVGALGFLTVGEIMKFEQGISFSTFFQSIEARAHIKLLLDGKIEEYVDKTSAYPFVSIDDFQNNEAIRNDKIEILTEAYENYIKGKNVRIDEVQSRYNGMLNENSKVISTYILLYIDDECIGFQMEKGGDGLFSVSNAGYSRHTDEPTSQMKNLAEAVDHVSNSSSFYTVTLQISGKSMLSKTGRAELFGRKFGEEYKEEFVERYADLREKAEVTDCIFAGTLYDTDAKRYYTKIALFVNDNKTNKTAVIKKKIYISGVMEYEFSDEPAEIIDGGVSSEVLDRLEKLF